jgi:hypothetical protein
MTISQHYQLYRILNRYSVELKIGLTRHTERRQRELDEVVVLRALVDEPLLEERAVERPR